MPTLSISIDYTYRLPVLTEKDGHQRARLSAPLRATNVLNIVSSRDEQAVLAQARTEIDTYIYSGDNLTDWQRWESERAQKNLVALISPFPGEEP